MTSEREGAGLGSRLGDSLLELIRRTSSDLPQDVAAALERARAREAEGSQAAYALDVILENVALARERGLPVCQDTGTLIFYVRHPKDLDQAVVVQAATRATVEATELGYLRQNSVDPITGKNSGNNLGPGSPVFHFHPEDREDIDVRLILKGGGSENVSTQYSLPNPALGAGRDLDGVRKVILDAVQRAQGKGCGPGILGVCIGGDRATGYAMSKEVLLRKLDEPNPMPELAELEERVMEQANGLGIGPMGFGGSTTILGCKIGYLNRLPASFFVSISYMCWAYRRRGAIIARTGEVETWLY